MNDKQLQDKLLQETKLCFPEHDLINQHPYDMDTGTFITLLPAPSNRTKYAAGAAACVAVLAGTAVAVHFLTIPGPGDVSSAPTLPSETTYSAVSTAPGETSGAEAETTAPKTDKTDSTIEGSATNATSTQHTISVTPTPTEPVKNQRGAVKDIVPGPEGYVLFENGDLYALDKTTTSPDGKVSTIPYLSKKNIDCYSKLSYMGTNLNTTLYLDKSGELSAVGYCPVLDGTVSHYPIYKESELLKVGKTVDKPVHIMSDVKYVSGRHILSKTGELYVYGIDNGTVYKEPFKILDNVSVIKGNTVITTSGELLRWEADGFTHIADHIKDAGYGDYQGYYITDTNDLYIFGNFVRCNVELDKPIKVAANVQKAEVSRFGYAYLTTAGDLYLATPFMKEDSNAATDPNHILEGGILYAQNVKAFSYYSILLYLDSTNTVRGFGGSIPYGLLPFTTNDHFGDFAILENVSAFKCDNMTAVATDFNGNVHIWGEGVIGVSYSDDSIGIPLMLEFPED